MTKTLGEILDARPERRAQVEIALDVLWHSVRRQCEADDDEDDHDLLAWIEARSARRSGVTP